MSALSRFNIGVIGISRKSKFKKAQPFFEERNEEIEESENEDLPIIPTYDSTSDISFDDSDLYGNTYEELSEERLPYGLFTNEETPINRKKRYNKILEPKGHRASRHSDVSESFEVPPPAESILLSFNTPKHNLNRTEITSPDVFHNTSPNTTVNNSNSQLNFTSISPIVKPPIQKELSYTDGLNDTDRQPSFINLFEKSDLTTSTEEFDIFGKRFLEQSSQIQDYQQTYNVPDANLAKVQENAEKTKSFSNSKNFNDKLSKSFQNIDFSGTLQSNSAESQILSNNININQSVLQELKAFADNEKLKENNSKSPISIDQKNNIQKVTQNNKSSVLPQNLLFLSSFENRDFDKEFIIKESHHKRERKSSSSSDSEIKPSKSRDISIIPHEKSNKNFDEIISQQNNIENDEKILPIEEIEVVNYQQHKKSKRKRSKVGNSAPVSIDDDKPFIVDEPVYMSPMKRLKVQKSKENIRFDSDFSDSPSKQRVLSENDDLTYNIMAKEEVRPHISPNNNIINNILNNDQQIRQAIQDDAPQENNKPRMRRSKHKSHEEIIESLAPTHKSRKSHKSLNNDILNDEEEDLPLFSQENDVFFTPKNENSSSEQYDNLNSSEINIPQSKTIYIDSFDEKHDKKRNFIFSNEENEKESTIETGESYNTFENDRNSSQISDYSEEDYYENNYEYEYDFDDGFEHNGAKKLDLFGPLSDFKSAAAKSENSTIDSYESDEITSIHLIESDINNDDQEEEKITLNKHNHLPKPPPELMDHDYSTKKHKKRSSKVPKDEDFEIPNEIFGESQIHKNQRFSSPPSAEFIDKNIKILSKEEKKKKKKHKQNNEQIDVDLINPNSNEINEDSDQISQELIPDYDINNHPSSDPFKDVILPKINHQNIEEQNNLNNENQIYKKSFNKSDKKLSNFEDTNSLNISQIDEDKIINTQRYDNGINSQHQQYINDEEIRNNKNEIKNDFTSKNQSNNDDKMLQNSRNMIDSNKNNESVFQNQSKSNDKKFEENDFTSKNQTKNQSTENKNKSNSNDFIFESESKTNDKKFEENDLNFDYKNDDKNKNKDSDDFIFQNQTNNCKKDYDALIERTFSVPDDFEDAYSDSSSEESDPVVVNHIYNTPPFEDKSKPKTTNSVNTQDSIKNSDPIKNDQNQQKISAKKHLTKNFDSDEDEEEKQVKERNLSPPVKQEFQPKKEKSSKENKNDEKSPKENKIEPKIDEKSSKENKIEEKSSKENKIEEKSSKENKIETKIEENKIDEKSPKENKNEPKIEEKVVEKKEKKKPVKKKLTEEEKAKIKAEREEKERKHQEFLKKLEIERINKKLKRYQKANNTKSPPPSPKLDENNSKFKDDESSENKGIRQHMKPFEESKYLDENDNSKNKLKHKDKKEAPKINYVASKFFDDDSSDSKDDLKIKEKPKQEGKDKKEESPVKKSKFLNFSSDDEDFDLKPSPHKKPKGRIKPKRHKKSSSSSDDVKSSKKKK